MGLIEMVPHLIEGDTAEAGVIHPLALGNGEPVELELGKVAREAATAMLPSRRPAEIRGDKQVVALAPVPFEFEKVELVGLYRLGYRTRNARTGAWWARLQNDCPRHVARYRELIAQHRVESLSLAGARATPPPDAAPEGVNGKLSSEQKLKRVDEIFPGAGATITNLARFSDWEHWGYDWDFDIEPTLVAIAAHNGPTFQPATLTDFDKPIGDTFRARLAGEIDADIARGMGRGKESEG
jgi:hypothetical protein